MRHVRSGRIAASATALPNGGCRRCHGSRGIVNDNASQSHPWINAIISLWRRRHPISIGVTTAEMNMALVTLVRPTVRPSQQQAQDWSTVGHAKPYTSYNSWSNLLIFGHNTLHRHTHRLTSAFFDLCPNVQMAVLYCWKQAKFCIFFPLAPKVWETGDPKRLTCVRGQVCTCLPNLVVIDQSWQAVGRGMTDRHTNRMEWQ